MGGRVRHPHLRHHVYIVPATDVLKLVIGHKLSKEVTDALRSAAKDDPDLNIALSVISTNGRGSLA